MIVFESWIRIVISESLWFILSILYLLVVVLIWKGYFCPKPHNLGQMDTSNDI